jgi:hypothetical protein
MSVSFSGCLTGRFEEVLGEALQYAACIVDRHFLGGVEAAGLVFALSRTVVSESH